MGFVTKLKFGLNLIAYAQDDRGLTLRNDS